MQMHTRLLERASVLPQRACEGAAAPLRSTEADGGWLVALKPHQGHLTRLALLTPQVVRLDCEQRSL